MIGFFGVDSINISNFFRKRNSVVHNYKYGFSGFATHLSDSEVKSIAQRPGVVSVFPDPVLQLHTTRSWDFLKYQTSVKIDSSPVSYSTETATDAIIGILDTGENFPSFCSRKLLFYTNLSLLMDVNMEHPYFRNLAGMRELQ